jgi:HECT-domain (ubiquitin-transferase)
MKQADRRQRASTFFLCAAPFLLSPRTKRNLLQMEHQVDMIRAATSNLTFDSVHREYVFEPYFCLSIDRQYLLQQTLQKISSASQTDLRKSLKIVFKGEDGVDAGGVTNEFFQLLSHQLFDVSTGMWTTRYNDDADSIGTSGLEVTFFNGGCTWNSDGYYLVGVLVGLALYNSVLLDVHFPRAVYRKLLGYSLGLEDVFDDELKNGLQQLLDYQGDDVDDVFCLTFEITWQDLGVTSRVELKENGANIPVTSSNREEYVLLYVKWLLVDSVETVYNDFERGVMHVLDGSSLDLLQPEELELLVVGSPILDFAALQRYVDANRLVFFVSFFFAASRSHTFT